MNGFNSGYRDRPWIPRFWDGMTLGDWVKMLARERFAIHPLRWPMTACVTTVTAFNSVYALLQQAFYRR